MLKHHMRPKSVGQFDPTAERIGEGGGITQAGAKNSIAALDVRFNITATQFFKDRNQRLHRQATIAADIDATQQGDPGLHESKPADCRSEYRWSANSRGRMPAHRHPAAIVNISSASDECGFQDSQLAGTHVIEPPSETWCVPDRGFPGTVFLGIFGILL